MHKHIQREQEIIISRKLKNLMVKKILVSHIKKG